MENQGTTAHQVAVMEHFGEYSRHAKPFHFNDRRMVVTIWARQKETHRNEAVTKYSVISMPEILAAKVTITKAVSHLLKLSHSTP
ncbi:6228_t:CDS:2 [Dentiscutata erythropus]|uniref:6228_t:CDS:1 n=1 Tax=Dentiscutata erythropus TaxID=1348616 RepID=A0A9N9FUR5_9GLOM|nr:6228_t:CDS:2 [Dentiscutata erythropus]